MSFLIPLTFQTLSRRALVGIVKLATCRPMVYHSSDYAVIEKITLKQLLSNNTNKELLAIYFAYHILECKKLHVQLETITMADKNHNTPRSDVIAMPCQVPGPGHFFKYRLKIWFHKHLKGEKAITLVVSFFLQKGLIFITLVVDCYISG